MKSGKAKMLVDKSVEAAVDVAMAAETTQKTSRKPIDGMAYDRIRGIVDRCPVCRMASNFAVTKTLAWEDGCRVRYHSCRRCGASVKSVEVE